MWSIVPNKFVDLAEKIEKEVEEICENEKKKKLQNQKLMNLQNIKLNEYKISNKKFFGDWIDEEQQINKFKVMRDAYFPHFCGPQCMFQTDSSDENILRSKNPFMKPFKKGFVRIFVKSKYDADAGIVYIAPCDVLSVRNFTLSKNFRLAKLENRFKYFIEDISNGTQNNSVNFLCDNENGAKQLGPYLQYPFYEEKTLNDILNYARKLNSCHHDSEFCITNEAQTDHTCECARRNKVQYKYERLYYSIQEPIWECNSRCKCGPNCTNKVVTKGHDNHLQIYPVPGKGYGIRATHFISKGTFVMSYYGKLVKNKYYFGTCDEYIADTHFSFGNEKDTISIEPGSYTLAGSFANHCCFPNLFVQSVIIETNCLLTPVFGLFAMRDINAFEELTWDYNYGLTSLPYDCNCHDETCKMALR